VIALLMMGFSATSHAAGSLIWPWVAVFVDWAHGLAVGVWVGGLAALVLVLPAALQPYAGDARWQALVVVLRRFSQLVVVAVTVVVTTGIYSALNWLYQPSDLTQSDWGLALLVKLALVGTLLLLGLAHNLAIRPERYQRWADRLRWSLSLEAGLSLLLLVAVAVLSATAVPEPAFLDAEIALPSAEQVAGDLDVSLTISPGGPGVNTFDVVVRRDDTMLDGAEVTIQIVSPAEDWRSPWAEVPPAGSGLYVTAGDDLRAAGHWFTLLDITPLEGEMTRAAFAWDITEEAAVPDSLPPGPLNILALVGVLLALGWAAYPQLRRFYRWLDWRPASIAAGVSAVIGTVLFIGLAVAVVRQSESAYNAQINPPPAVVNNVLPDAASLEQGRELYTAHCIQWQAYSADFRALIERLPRTRDENLFQATLSGWQNLPPCTGDLTAAERWHIVNFFRTLA
jgi:uncharacterized membrane protein